MKKRLLWMILLLCLLFAFPVSAAKTAGEWKKAENGESYYYVKGKKANGFVEIQKKTYYFKKGKLVKNKWFFYKKLKYRANSSGVVLKNRFITVSGKKYYLRANGSVQKSWKNIGGNRYYFGSSGAMSTGLTLIRGKYYYFNSKGVLQTGVQTVGKTTYFLNDKGALKAKKVKNTYYDAKGKKMNQVQTLNFETLLRAKKIVSGITNSGMSQEQKLLTCFRWVMSKTYVTPRKFSNFDGWPAVYANDHFQKGSGNCQSDAAAFAYLAKALGYTNVYVCADSDGTWGMAHSWTEINGKVYDPLFAESKGFDKHYGVAYGTYVLHPILHIAI